MIECVYDPKQQQELIFNLIEKTRAAANSPVATEAREFYFHHVLETFYRGFALIAARIKHPSFEEEGEWRLISDGMTIHKPLDGKNLTDSKAVFHAPRTIRLRPGGSTLIPYVEVPLANADGRLPIYRVRVGPNIDPERAANSVSLLLASNNQHAMKGVCASTIPYRTW